MPRKMGSVTGPDVLYIAQLTKLLRIRKKLPIEKRKAARIQNSQAKKAAKNNTVNDAVTKDVARLEKLHNAKQKIQEEQETLRAKAAALVAQLEEDALNKDDFPLPPITGPENAKPSAVSPDASSSSSRTPPIPLSASGITNPKAANVSNPKVTHTITNRKVPENGKL